MYICIYIYIIVACCFSSVRVKICILAKASAKCSALSEVIGPSPAMAPRPAADCADAV